MRCAALSAVALSVLGTASEAGSAAELAASETQRTISAAEAQATCPPVLDVTDPDESCRPGEFGEIGAVDHHAFVFALYDYMPKGTPVARYSRIVVFERVGAGILRAVLAPEPDIATFFEKPKVLRSGRRTLLHIPGYESGTGNFNRERLFVWRGDRWRNVDVTAWLADLTHRLPAGYGAWKGIYPDYARMGATTSIWRDGDSNACPTGGQADLALGWRGDRIVLKAIHRHRAGECGERLPHRHSKADE